MLARLDQDMLANAISFYGLTALWLVTLLEPSACGLAPYVPHIFICFVCACARVNEIFVIMRGPILIRYKQNQCGGAFSGRARAAISPCA